MFLGHCLWFLQQIIPTSCLDSCYMLLWNIFAPTVCLWNRQIFSRNKHRGTRRGGKNLGLETVTWMRWVNLDNLFCCGNYIDVVGSLFGLPRMQKWRGGIWWQHVMCFMIINGWHDPKSCLPKLSLGYLAESQPSAWPSNMEDVPMSIDEEEGPIAELIAYFETVSWLYDMMKHHDDINIHI